MFKSNCTTFLLMSCFILTNSDININDFSKLFIKFLQNLNKPILVSAYTCWENENNFQLSRLLMNAGYRINVAQTVAEFQENQQSDNVLYLLDMQCPEIYDILSQVDDYNFRSPYNWFLLESTVIPSETYDFLEDAAKHFFSNISILVDSQFFFCKQLDENFLLFELYRNGPATQLLVEPYAAYDVMNGTLRDLRSSQITSRRRQNLKGANIRASLVITDNNSLNHLTDYKDKHIDTISKVNYLLTGHAVEMLNASVSFSIVNSWGYRSDDGLSWSGMIGELFHDKADIGASPLFFTVDRISVIDYIAMPSSTCSRFVFRSPKLSYTDNVYLLPFEVDVWLSTAALVVVCSIILLFTTKMEWSYDPNEILSEDSGVLRPRATDVTVLAFGAVCQQGSSSTPRSHPARLATMLLFISLMFLYTSYSANIVALLQSPSSRIKTLENLLQSRLKLGVHDTVFNRHYFTTATEPVRKAIYDQKVAPSGAVPNFISLNEGVNNLRKGLFAFHMELGVGYKVISETFFEDEKCDLREIQFLQVIDPWLAVQKNSSYKEMIKINMQRIHEHGLQQRENLRLYTRKPKCSGVGGHFISVGLVDCRAALLVLVWGILASLLALFIEIVIKRLFRYRQNTVCEFK